MQEVKSNVRREMLYVKKKQKSEENQQGCKEKHLAL